MSRTSFGRPEYRLALDYPHITVTQGEAPARVYDLARATLLADLRRLGAEIRAAGGRLTVVLPEREVWRGRLALEGTRSRSRAQAARSGAARAMGLAEAEVAVRLGRPGADGTLPAAAVRRETLAETRGFLARAGLRPSRITGAGDFDGFDEAPPLDAGPLRDMFRPALPAAGGLLAAAAVLALMLRPDALPPEAGLANPAPVQLAAGVEAQTAPVVAEIGPRARPADLVRVTAVPEVEPAAPGGAPDAPRTPTATAGLTFQPPVTMASRNLPAADLPPVPMADNALRLSDLHVARARIADTIMALPLIRASAPAPSAPPPVASPAPVTTTAPAGDRAVAPTPVAATPATIPATARPVAQPEAAAARPLLSSPRPPRRPAPVAAATPEPEPAPQPLAVAAAEPAPKPEPEGPRPQATVASGSPRAIAPPPARPRDAVAAQVGDAVGAAVVVASLAPTTATVLNDSGALAAVARPEPRRAAPAPQPARQAAPAPAPQRVAAVQPQRQQPQRAVAAPARQVARAAPTRPVANTARAVPQTQRPAAAQPARQPQPQRAAAVRRPASNNATSSALAGAAATQSVGLSRRAVSLIGVFGAERDRYAMVRLPNGRMQRVRPGDQVQGARVAAIGQNSVQLTSSGRTTTLGMPN